MGSSRARYDRIESRGTLKAYLILLFGPGFLFFVEKLNRFVMLYLYNSAGVSVGSEMSGGVSNVTDMYPVVKTTCSRDNYFCSH